MVPYFPELPLILSMINKRIPYFRMRKSDIYRILTGLLSFRGTLQIEAKLIGFSNTEQVPNKKFRKPVQPKYSIHLNN